MTAELKIGDRVRITKGWWIAFHDPIVDTSDLGTQSDGTLTGRVARRHLHPGTLYVSLDNGRLASTAIASLEPTDQAPSSGPQGKDEK